MGYLLSFTLPLTSFFFLSTGPHSALEALAFTVPFWIMLYLDWRGPSIRRNSPVDAPTFYYASILYLLAGLHFCNLGLMLAYVAALPWQTPDDFVRGILNLVLIRFLVGASSGTSGIVVSHELIHRKSQFSRALGHLILISLFYDHFVIAHERGHHDHLGGTEDVATAHFDEKFEDYWSRVYKGYFKYAWRMEGKRLESQNRLTQAVKNQVIRGIILEIGFLLVVLYYFGWLAALILLYQAFAAVRILEAVNYFQHWGLNDPRVGKSYGWVTDSWISRYSLIGLTNHIGHHQNPLSPYYAIAYSERGPKLPYGYFLMNLWVKLHNSSYRKVAASSLLCYQE